jgi:2-haloacid dehalogenase
MPSDRRNFLALASATVATYLLPAATQQLSARPTRIKAIAFDALAIFDTRPVFALVNQLFPTQGVALGNEWRTRQFESTWLRVAEKRYADFWQVTQDALRYAAQKTKVDLSGQQRDALMNAYLELKAWPDVLLALTSLKQSGHRLAFLSNFTPRMLDACIRTSAMEGLFEQVLSTDQAKTYKPDPAAYQLGVDALKLPKESILFAAFAGWDAAGAKAFGYPTYWVNRLDQPTDEPAQVLDGVGSGLADLVRYLTR